MWLALIVYSVVFSYLQVHLSYIDQCAECIEEFEPIVDAKSILT